jgi:hypothetical protein
VSVVQVVTTGDENVPAMVARSGSNVPPHGHPRASLHSNALMTHPITDILDGTLWNRDLGSASEDIVTTLVQQLFTGIRDYIVQVPSYPNILSRVSCLTCRCQKQNACAAALVIRASSLSLRVLFASSLQTAGSS